ncbi:unnamed protein product, partial [Ectocarpus sp. 4 AP-2014]
GCSSKARYRSHDSQHRRDVKVCRSRQSPSCRDIFVPILDPSDPINLYDPAIFCCCLASVKVVAATKRNTVPYPKTVTAKWHYRGKLPSCSGFTTYLVGHPCCFAALMDSLASTRGLSVLRSEHSVVCLIECRPSTPCAHMIRFCNSAPETFHTL